MCVCIRYEGVVFRRSNESDFIEVVLKMFECVGGECVEAVMHTRLITSTLRLLGGHWFYFFHSQISLCTRYVNMQST